MALEQNGCESCEWAINAYLTTAEVKHGKSVYVQQGAEDPILLFKHIYLLLPWCVMYNVYTFVWTNYSISEKQNAGEYSVVNLSRWVMHF